MHEHQPAQMVFGPVARGSLQDEKGLVQRAGVAWNGGAGYDKFKIEGNCSQNLNESENYDFFFISKTDTQQLVQNEIGLKESRSSKRAGRYLVCFIHEKERKMESLLLLDRQPTSVTRAASMHQVANHR